MHLYTTKSKYLFVHHHHLHICMYKASFFLSLFYIILTFQSCLNFFPSQKIKKKIIQKIMWINKKTNRNIADHNFLDHKVYQPSPSQPPQLNLNPLNHLNKVAAVMSTRSPSTTSKNIYKNNATAATFVPTVSHVVAATAARHHQSAVQVVNHNVNNKHNILPNACTSYVASSHLSHQPKW